MLNHNKQFFVAGYLDWFKTFALTSLWMEFIFTCISFFSSVKLQCKGKMSACGQDFFKLLRGRETTHHTHTHTKQERERVRGHSYLLGHSTHVCNIQGWHGVKSQKLGTQSRSSVQVAWTQSFEPSPPAPRAHISRKALIWEVDILTARPNACPKIFFCNVLQH